MYHRIREIRATKPIFAMDFQNDGEYVGGCIAGGRRYLHINANGDVDPCVFIHYSNANIREVSLLDALRSLSDSELFRTTGAAAFLSLVDSFREKVAYEPISELLSELLDRSGYERALRTEGSGERLDNLAELKQSVHEYEVECGEETTLDSYLQHISLFTGADSAPERNAVRMMTVHTAKGLEFPYVFLLSLSEGIFPSKKTADLDGMEE